ncbi:MAG: ATP synthase F1 subunit delta [Bacteroidales bacterium]|nr:ATP synthase F1 subunit delta [Bacteroidales bacterium]
MNTGIIASRYAAALYKWVGKDEAIASLVCSQAKVLVSALSLEKLRALLGDAALQQKQKTDLLQAAVSPEVMEPHLKSFLELVLSNGRVAELRFILNSYVNLYYRQRNIHFATFRTATKLPKETSDRIVAVAESMLKGKLTVEESINPDLIGGLVVEVDGYRYDASVRTALKTIEEQFVEKNKRIV